MAKNDKEKWISDSSCLSLDVMTNYIQGKLDRQAQLAVEKHLADCELCSEALAGLEMDSNLETLPFLIDDMKQEFAQKHFHNQDSQSSRHRLYYLYRATAVAAILVIAFGGYYFIQHSKTNNQGENLDKIYAEYYQPYPNVITTTSYSEKSKAEQTTDGQSGAKNKSVVPSSAGDKLSKSLNDQKAQGPVNSTNEKDKKLDNWAADSISTRSGVSNTLTKTPSPSESQGVNSTPVQTIQTITSNDESVTPSNGNSVNVPGKQAELETSNSAPQVAEEVTGNSINQITTTPQTELLLDRAMKLYDNNDHDSAIVLFDEILQQEPTNSTVQFYEGNSYLQEGNVQKGMDKFKNLSNDRSSQYYDASQWYLALSYLKDNNKQSAIPILTDLANGDSQYKDRANQILKIINK